MVIFHSFLYVYQAGTPCSTSSPGHLWRFLFITLWPLIHHLKTGPMGFTLFFGGETKKKREIV
jgi:hypothetical protein